MAIVETSADHAELRAGEPGANAASDAGEHKM
jgi:hypothetical protein